MSTRGIQNLTFNRAAWDELERGVVDRHLRPAAERIAARCNEESAAAEHPGHFDGEPTRDEEKRGYRAGTEGTPGKTLEKGGYRATVITATKPAMADNARHNRLINHCHPGGLE